MITPVTINRLQWKAYRILMATNVRLSCTNITGLIANVCKVYLYPTLLLHLPRN